MRRVGEVEAGRCVACVGARGGRPVRLSDEPVGRRVPKRLRRHGRPSAVLSETDSERELLRV